MANLPLSILDTMLWPTLQPRLSTTLHHYSSPRGIHSAHTEDSFVYHLELAGVASADQVTVEYERLLMTVRANTDLQEYKYTFSIPTDIDLNGATCVVSNGMLTITIPKKYTSTKTQLSVTVE